MNALIITTFICFKSILSSGIVNMGAHNTVPRVIFISDGQTTSEADVPGCFPQNDPRNKQV